MIPWLGSHHDRGEVSVETVLYLPVLLLLFLTAFHFAALSHAGHIAAVAASRGAGLASTGMSTHGETLMINDEIVRVANEMGADLVGSPRMSIDRRTVTVSVTMRSPRVVPLFPSVVTRTASQAREEFLLEQDR